MQTLEQEHPRQRTRLLIFSTATAPHAECAKAARQFGSPLFAVATPGEALRQIVLLRPAVVVVLVTGDEEIDAAASLIAELRHRRPRIPVIALAREQNDEVERRLRAVGASAYVAGFCDLATAVVCTALTAPAPQQAAISPGVHSGCSPPLAPRRRPMPRIRGRPRGASG